MQEKQIEARGVRFSIVREGEDVAHAYLYLLTNDLHAEPFGLLEDVFVDETYRNAGAGRELVNKVITKAKAEKCYKLLATSRNDGTRQSVHDWYLRLGFRDYGTEFRMDL